MAELEYHLFKSDRKFGIELEVGPTVSQKEIADTIGILNPSSKVVVSTHWRQTNYNNTDWQVKQDSTCGPDAHLKKKSYGWEIVPRVSSWSTFNDIARTIDVLRLRGVEPNSNCGLHVHVDASDLTIPNVAVFMAWWCKSEAVVCNMVPSRRIHSDYCKLYQHCFALHDFYSLAEFWEEIKPTDYSVHDNPERRFAVNLVNFCAWNEAGCICSRKLPTLELRLPEGTMYSDDVKGWVLLFLLMVERFPTLSVPANFFVLSLEEFLWALGLIGTPGSFYILDEDLFFLKKWIFSRLGTFSRNNLLRQQARFLYNYVTELPSRRDSGNVNN